MPPDPDAGQQDEDTFGVSFLSNDVDVAATKDVAGCTKSSKMCHLFKKKKKKCQHRVLTCSVRANSETIHQNNVTVVDVCA